MGSPITGQRVHEDLSTLLAEMMGATAGTRAPRPHVSFLALGGEAAHAAEMAAMVSTLFGLDVSEDDVLCSPTPDSLARSVQAGWLEAGLGVDDLAERIAVIADEA